MASIRNLSNEPLALGDFPAPLKKHVDPRAPFPLRDMGAKGLVPGIAPPHLLMVLYQLQFDPEERVKENARNTFRELPDDLVLPAIQTDLPASVLDFCARRWLRDKTRIEKIIRNKNVDDNTVAFVANKCDDQIAEIVSENQARLVRSPVIVEQLYLNPKAHQSTLDRILEFIQRQGVTLTGLPGLQRALEADLTRYHRKEEEEAQAQPAESTDDNAFALILEESVAQAEVEKEQGISAEEIEEKVFGQILNSAMDRSANRQAETAQDPEPKPQISRQIQLQKMRISQRVRIATVGSKEDRAILIRDPNRVVHMAALLSPKTQPKDLKAYAGNKNLPDNVINFIANKRELIRDYSMKRTLLNNPKLSLRMSLRLLNFMQVNDLRALTRNRNISPQLAKAAKNLLRKKSERKR